ncbi:LacI family DNA-binding transcriptional regulator [Halalkalibacter urbisdiaboli]|uniref:LacI family DNA-binding transcriptional regulator n=1 Tax=Halalkalibacter urbisdiaboli TaxID=1960589 RepID=UPI0013FD74FD|nr:LacI family DNA-binding transcriptional regulator [Halalkalibacter urbisdiaboli]
MGVTIKDIAKQAGVSYSTVSKALRNSPLVKEPTKNKIHRIAEELGYQPNVVARSLVQKKSYTVGVIWPSVERVAPSKLITKINDLLEEHSYTTLLSINKLESAVATFNRLQVDAILVFGENEFDLNDSERFRSMVPILYYGIKENSIYPTIDVNRRLAIKLAVDYLKQIGHTKIAFLGDLTESETLQKEKFIGYQEAMDEAIVKANPELIIPTNGLEVYDGYLAAKSFFSKNTGATAMVSGSYDLTRGVLRATSELHIDVPKDLSLISYDNIQQFENIEVPLTTVGVPLNRIAKRVTEVLLNIIDKEIHDSIILEPELSILNSCTPRK